MLEKVLAGVCDTYDVKKIKEFIEKCLNEINFKVTKSKILLKPNLLSSKTPEKAVTTHPIFVQAISEIFLDLSCSVSIGDSPGYESTEKVLMQSGIMSIVKSHNLKIRTFDRRIIKYIKGISPYSKFTLGEDPDDYDFIINIPKLKSHSMMGLTLGVKNMFGFIPSFEKAKWHLKAGKDRMLFASVLIDIYNVVKPSLTILDGISGMDGDGPSNGRVNNFGIMLTCKSSFELDYVIEKLIGPSGPMPISNMALKHNLIKKYSARCVYPFCNDIDFCKKCFVDFKFPKTINTDWRLPVFIKNTLSKIFIKTPKINKNRCKNCQICLNVCPVKAISNSGITPNINYKKCISCYCCQEMCPESAITIL